MRTAAAALVFLALTAAALPAAPAGPMPSPAPAAAPAPPRFVAEVPFTPCDGLICLAVTLGDGRRQTFILDTGNVRSYVAADTARAHGWKLGRAIGRDGRPVAGLSQTGPIRLRLGALVLETEMLVFERKDLGPGNVPFDGGLVFTALHDRIIQIDFPRQVVRISEVALGAAAAQRPGTLKTITFGKRGPAILTGGPFTVNGEPMRAQIDTAYAGTMLIYDQAIAGLGLEAAAKASAGHAQTFPYTDGGVAMLAALASSVGFAGRILDDHSPMIYFPTPGVHQPDGLFEATVGTAFFRSTVLTLDLHAMTFDVEPASAATHN
jgi:hypothetical protein